MANFFANPMIPRVTNPEPAGFNLIRQMLMNQMFQRNANPYGMNPGGQTGGNPLFPSGGRGAFDPYGGMNPGAFSPGGGKGRYGSPGPPGQGVPGPLQEGGGRMLYNPNAAPGGPYQGGGPDDRSGRNAWMGGGGGSTGNNFMQMLQNFLQQYQGGGQGGGRNVGMRGGGLQEGGGRFPIPREQVEAGGVGIGTRTPSPGTGGIEPGAGGTNTEDQGGGGAWTNPTNRGEIIEYAPPPGYGAGMTDLPWGGGTMMPPWATEGRNDVGGGRMPISTPGGGRGRPGGPTFAAPPETPPTPYTPGSSGFDGNPSYDGRADVSKMMHAHQKMMTSVLPMLLQAPRVAAAAPSMTSGGPMPGYDGAMLTRPGGGYAPYDGMAPENAPSWTPLSERSGGTGLNLSESNTPNSLPASRDVPPLPRPGYDGNDDAAYGGFRHVRAPNVAPRPSMGVRPPMNVAANLQRLLGARRPPGAFRGSAERARGPAPSYDGQAKRKKRSYGESLSEIFNATGNAAGMREEQASRKVREDVDALGHTPSGSMSGQPMSDEDYQDYFLREILERTRLAGEGERGREAGGRILDEYLKRLKGYDGVAYDASGSNVSSVPIGGDPTPITGTPPTAVDTGGSASPYPTGAQTGGQAMYPWLMPYTGQRTAAMSPYEIQGLEGMSDFVGGGMGLGGSRKYLDDLLSGKYIGSDNPYMADFQKGAQTLKESEDAMARQRIGSSMAAGGNALSGARIASEQQYQNTSDAQFQKMLAEMQMQNLARERALQQGGVGLSGNLAGEQLGGLSALMNAGAVPRGIQQGDFNSQYQDWLRQIGSMNQQDQFQQNLATQMLHTSPGAYQPGYGTSAAEGIAALLAGSGAAGGIGDLLKKLFSGGGSGGSKGGGGGGGNTGGGGGGGRPGQDASGNTPEDPEYNPATDPANWGDMGYGTYGPDLPGNYNPETGEWEQFGPNLPPGYDPETGGYDMGGGQYGPFLPGEDPWAGTGGSNDMGGWDWGAGPGGDYMTGGYDDYPTYGDTSGDWSGWG